MKPNEKNKKIKQIQNLKLSKISCCKLSTFLQYSHKSSDLPIFLIRAYQWFFKSCFYKYKHYWILLHKLTGHNHFKIKKLVENQMNTKQSLQNYDIFYSLAHIYKQWDIVLKRSFWLFYKSNKSYLSLIKVACDLYKFWICDLSKWAKAAAVREPISQNTFSKLQARSQLQFCLFTWKDVYDYPNLNKNSFF